MCVDFVSSSFEGKAFITDMILNIGACVYILFLIKFTPPNLVFDM